MQSTVIKYGLLIAGAALGAFAVALLGAYLLMPSIAPETAGMSTDSLDAAGQDTTRQASMPGNTTAMSSPDTTAMQASRDSTEKAIRDSMRMASSLVERLRDSLTVVGRLQDSLRALKKQLRTAEQETETLQERIASLESREAKVGELKDALLGMGRRELATVLANVDMEVLKELYQRTSGRTRTQLLNAISAERTAQFVNQVVGGDDAPTDTTDTQEMEREGDRGASPFR